MHNSSFKLVYFADDTTAFSHTITADTLYNIVNPKLEKVSQIVSNIDKTLYIIFALKTLPNNHNVKINTFISCAYTAFFLRN